MRKIVTLLKVWQNQLAIKLECSFPCAKNLCSIDSEYVYCPIDGHRLRAFKNTDMLFKNVDTSEEYDG